MYLKAEFEKNCIGCELCVMEVQRQLNKVGLEGSPIRIFKNGKEKGIAFKVEVDISVNNLDIKKISQVCPALVFSLVEKEEESDDLAS